MAVADITTGLQTDTSTGAITGSLDISGVTGDFTVKLRIAALTAAKSVTIALQDTVDAYSASRTQWVKQFTGLIAEGADLVVSISKRELPHFRAGTASAECRFNILVIDGSASVDTHGWLEY